MPEEIENEEIENIQEEDQAEDNYQEDSHQEDTKEGDASEGRARRLGWKPKDEYNGNPKYWVDADKFIERGESELPIMKENNRKLERDVKEMKESFEKMRKFSEMQIESAKERAMNELRDKQIRSVEEDDMPANQAFDEYERGKADIEKKYESQNAQQPQIDPEVKRWNDDNPWYGDDFQLTQAANFYSNKYQHLPVREQLEEVKRRVTQDFPGKFKNPRRNQPDAIEGGNTVHTTGRKRGKASRDIPADDLADGHRMVRAGDYKDIEAFAKDYWKLYGDSK